MLIRVRAEVDPHLEMAEIHRRIFDRGGPAILFERVKGSPFQALSNLYGTYEQTDFLFRHTLERVQRVIELKADPANLAKRPLRYLEAPFTALRALPKRQYFSSPIRYGTTTIDQLPLIKSWPMDGGPFVTLPQVLTLPPETRSIMQSNLGMYRIQLTGNDYVTNEEIGMHYQIHRGIGVHHTMYKQHDEPFRCSIFVGGPPSHALSAIMPLPEGLSELTFAGMLGGRRFRYHWHDGYLLSGDADFVITGTIRKRGMKPEGPFGDHLGYYSLQHDFPVMDVHQVYYRKNPLWHFTVVGRPPQEDSSFGYLIHKLVRELTPQEFPGIRQINAVDAAGVHPLLLAIGSERYMPFIETHSEVAETGSERVPEEILTQATRILGSGQTSLAKFLLIASEEDNLALDTHDIPDFFRHLLERVDFRRDLHFFTKTTIDTLDYSGAGWNAGSKVIMACRGRRRRRLKDNLSGDIRFPDRFGEARFVMPGILALQGPRYTGPESEQHIRQLASQLQAEQWEGIPLIVVCDDPVFLSEHFNNFLWATFTRANPSHDIDGVGAFIDHKHWGCTGPLLIDARVKPHHAPGLETDPEVARRVDALFTSKGELAAFG